MCLGLGSFLRLFLSRGVLQCRVRVSIIVQSDEQPEEHLHHRCVPQVPVGALLLLEPEIICDQSYKQMCMQLTPPLESPQGGHLLGRRLRGPCRSSRAPTPPIS